MRPLAVTILAEAGRGIGLGHLRRCQALAGALVAAGATVELIVAGEGWEPASAVALDWLGDPAMLRASLDAQRPDAVVVDSYRADEVFLRRLCARVPRLVVVDDLADRVLPVSMVVNGAWHAAHLPYQTDPDTLRLLGPEYALLDPVFAEPVMRPPAAEVRRVLVTFGGDPDTVAALDTAVAAMRREVPGVAIDVAVATPVATDLTGDAAVTLHRCLPSLRELISSADLVVSAGGMTLYECLASGVPVVATVLADNQRSNVQELANAGFVVSATPSLTAAVARVVGDAGLRRTLAARGRRAVAGRGATRVALEIVSACRAVGLSEGAR
jgi:spore coat polysaccharide biosynthesis predicted glycosyltransferase SpsG